MYSNLGQELSGLWKGVSGGGGVQGHLDPLQNRTLIPPTHTWQTKLFLVLDPPPPKLENFLDFTHGSGQNLFSEQSCITCCVNHNYDKETI